MYQFFEQVYVEHINFNFKESVGIRLNEETAQRYFLYLKNNCDLEHDNEIIPDMYSTLEKLKMPLDSKYNSQRKEAEKQLRLNDINTLPWEDGNKTVDDFIRCFIEIVNRNITDKTTRLKYIRYMADYVRICDRDYEDKYKIIMKSIEKELKN